MPFCPSGLRRSGYNLPDRPRNMPNAGFCGLLPHQSHALQKFVTTQPPRVLAEFLMGIVVDHLSIDQMIARAEAWGAGLSPDALSKLGGDRFPANVMREVPRHVSP